MSGDLTSKEQLAEILSDAHAIHCAAEVGMPCDCRVPDAIAELLRRAEPPSPSQAQIDMGEMLLDVESTLTDLGWHKDRGILKRVTEVVDAYVRHAPTKNVLHCPHDKDPDDCMHCADRQPDETSAAQPWRCTICSNMNPDDATHCRQCEYSRMVTREGQLVPRDGRL